MLILGKYTYFLDRWEIPGNTNYPIDFVIGVPFY